MERLKTIVILALLAALAGSIALAATGGEAEVRISARQRADGRVEFALQQRVDGEWGNRILPNKRFFPASVGHTRWLDSTPMTVSVAPSVDALELEEPGVYGTRHTETPNPEDDCWAVIIDEDHDEGASQNCPVIEPDPNDENPPTHDPERTD